MRRLFLLLTLFAGLFGLAACEGELANLLPTNQDNPQARMMESRSKLREANVAVQAEFSSTTILPTPSFETQGSGVIFARDGDTYYVLTNQHVVDPGDRPYAEYAVRPSAAQETMEAELVDMDESRDLALMRFTDSSREYEPLDLFARIDEPLERGEFVLAVGSPSEVDSIVTFGEYLRMSEIADVDFEVIAHSALIYPGSSGGALADLDGNLIGINTWSASDDAETNLSVPLTEVHDYLEALGVLEVAEAGENDGDD